MKHLLHGFAFLALALGGCETGGGGVGARRDPADDHRSATYDVERHRRDMINSKPEDPFHDMNQRQLNWALERQGKAIEDRFLNLERKAEEPPPPPAPSPIRWMVLQPDNSLGFAVSPGNAPTDGTWTKWAEQGGRKLLQFEIVNGLKEGKEISFYLTGKRKSETLFRKGKRNGSSTSWRPNGNKLWERHYKDDKKDGPWISYNEDGTELRSTTYKNGEEVIEE